MSFRKLALAMAVAFTGVIATGAIAHTAKTSDEFPRRPVAIMAPFAAGVGLIVATTITLILNIIHAIPTPTGPNG